MTERPGALPTRERRQVTRRRMPKVSLAAVAVGAAAALAACSAPSLPPGVLPTNDVVPASQGPPPHLNPMLVPYTTMVIANPDWTKEPTPATSVQLYAPKGCNAATTNFAMLSATPDAYEVLVGCPMASDINVLWTQVNWSKIIRAGWKPTSRYGTFGSANRAFVQWYAFDTYGDGCWAYIDMFKVNNVLGFTGYCDELEAGVTSLPNIKTAAEQWTGSVVQQITNVEHLKSPATTTTARQVTI